MHTAGSVAVVGVPLDVNSSFLRGSAGAPDRIREALRSDSSNMWAENGVDLGSNRGWRDEGNIGSADRQPSFSDIEERLDALLAEKSRVVALGGDHSISYPLVRAYARHHAGLTIVHLDAHPDLYDELEGSRISHGCPFARIMEEGLAERMVSIGIRTANAHQRQQAERFGVESFGVRDDWTAALSSLRAPFYLSIDLDVLDPAFAPGISHYEPGGLSTRDVLDIIHALPDPPAGADIVELNPDRDRNGVTAMVAAKLLKEILAGIVAAEPG